LRDIQKQIAFANAFGQIIFLFDIQKSRHYAVYQRMQAIYPPDSIASRFVRTFDKGPTSNVLLELAIEEGKHKDRSNNSYDGVQIEREIEYDSINQLAVDQTDDVGVIKLRFTYTEQFESNPLSDMGALEDQVVHDVKMIMVQYGVRFDTAFFLYRMEFLKRNKSLYFTPSDNANLEKFMQEQSYDPSRLSADELIALRQYQTGYIGNINNLLRFNR